MSDWHPSVIQYRFKQLVMSFSKVWTILRKHMYLLCTEIAPMQLPSHKGTDRFVRKTAPMVSCLMDNIKLSEHMCSNTAFNAQQSPRNWKVHGGFRRPWLNTFLSRSSRFPSPLHTGADQDAFFISKSEYRPC